VSLALQDELCPRGVFDEDVYPQLARLQRILHQLKIEGIEDFVEASTPKLLGVIGIDTEHFKISSLLSARPDLLPNGQCEG
jgi:hypothetical protein